MVTSLTTSDAGGNSVVVDADSITVAEDGSYSLTADLSDLDDGTLSVAAEIEDAAGNTISTVDTIEKDTTTSVSIDDVLIEADEAPTITAPVKRVRASR